MRSITCVAAAAALMVLAGCAGPINQGEAMGGSDANFEGYTPATGHSESDSSGLGDYRDILADPGPF